VGSNDGELQIGAGIAQVFDGTSDWGYWASHWDDPGDQFAIWLGAWLFENYPEQTLTEDIFNQAMQQYHEHLNQ
jgi:hypothetical protein